MRKAPSTIYALVLILVCGAIFLLTTRRLSKNEPIPTAPSSDEAFDQGANILPEGEILDGAPDDIPEDL